MQHPLLETFPLFSPNRKRAEKAFGIGRFRKVEYVPSAPLGNCYWNVNDQVSRNGGAATYGWQILQWPRLYIQALHHAVWKTPKGKLVDITAKYPTDNRPFTTFVEDDSFEVSLETPLFIENKYFSLSSASEVKELIENAKAQLEQKRDLVNMAVSLGAVWKPKDGLHLTPEIQEQLASQIRKSNYWLDQMSVSFRSCAKIR